MKPPEELITTAKWGIIAAEENIQTLRNTCIAGPAANELIEANISFINRAKEWLRYIGELDDQHKPIRSN